MWNGDQLFYNVMIMNYGDEPNALNEQLVMWWLVEAHCKENFEGDFEGYFKGSSSGSFIRRWDLEGDSKGDSSHSFYLYI